MVSISVKIAVQSTNLNMIAGDALDSAPTAIRKENTMTNYVCGFAFNLKHEVALVTKAKPEWQKGKLNGVGGKIETTDKSFAHAMAREFKEETQVETLPEKWQHFVTLKGADWRVYFFFMQLWDCPQLVGLPEEPASWHHVYNLPENVHHNLRWLIPLALDSDIVWSPNYLFLVKNKK